MFLLWCSIYGMCTQALLAISTLKKLPLITSTCCFGFFVLTLCLGPLDQCAPNYYHVYHILHCVTFFSGAYLFLRSPSQSGWMTSPHVQAPYTLSHASEEVHPDCISTRLHCKYQMTSDEGTRGSDVLLERVAAKKKLSVRHLQSKTRQ